MVKSLYLGMPIDDALGLLFKSLCSDGSEYYIYPKVIKYREVPEIMENKGFLEGDLAYSATALLTHFVQENVDYDNDAPVVVMFVENLLLGYVFADTYGKVEKIGLLGNAVDFLFNASHMDTQ